MEAKPMARKATQPKYYPSRRGYYVWFQGRQHQLAKGPKNDPAVKAKAQEAFHALMLTSLEPQAGDRIPAYSVLNGYVAWAETNRKRRTFKNRVQYLQGFSDRYGRTLVCDLTIRDAETFMDSQPRWGAASRDQFITSVNAAFNWAVKRKLVKTNPFKGMEKPVIRSRARTKDDYITDEVLALFLGQARPAHRDIILALDATGARPEELAVLLAADYNPALGTLMPKVSKNERHEAKGRPPRTIYVLECLRPTIERLCRENPTGPLFRNTCGRAWQVHNLDRWFREVRERLGLTGQYTPYGLRHRFATRYLLKGGSMSKLATLLDTSVRVIEHHYGHLDLHGEDLRREAERLLGGWAQDEPAADVPAPAALAG
jgi:integrase